MFCFKCGGAMADNATACPSCGTPAPTAAVLPPPGPAAVAAVQAVPVQQTEDKAVISLVLGILSLVSFSILTGIPAIIVGRMSRENIRASAGHLTGEGMATAGIVMGWISVGLAVLFLLFIVLMVLYLIPGGRYR